MARHSAKRLAVFNHKGGVGKTTITVNLASALSQLGKTVLLVDSDPQCNLTSYLFEDSVVDDLLDNSDKENGETIWSSVKPIVEGSGPIKIIDCYETTTTNCFVIPGDLRLSEYEIELAGMWGDCVQAKPRGFNGTTGLSRLINEIATSIRADYVFYDTGPNVGPLNRAILLDCDFYIVPAACDVFSIRALKTLGKSMTEWITRWKNISTGAPIDAPSLLGDPKLLGFVTQGFQVYNGGMARASAKYQAKFERRIKPDLINPLRRIDDNYAPPTASSSRLGEIKNFSTLVQMGQEQGVPLWEVYGGPPYQLQEAKQAFTDLANKVIERA